MISIIVRTKNEEKWITPCLSAIFNQDYQNFEVILVDNMSTDKTVEKAKNFDVKLVTVDKYLPGDAINAGIRESHGDYIAIISAHCIPVNSKWLSSLLANFNDTKVAGVYGRQEPMSFTPDADKRDLLNMFGLDRRVQVKDSFFHNANSMIRRDVWQAIPFDDTVTNIEDRVWGKAVLEAGYNLVYEPEASVYHWHGIHQNGNAERCKNVVRILESLHDEQNGFSGGINLSDLNVLAIIPSKGEPEQLCGNPLLAYTVAMAKESRFINRVVVSTENNETALIARNCGAEVPFMRPASLSRDYVDIGEVFRHTLEELERENYFPDLVVLLQETFPFRPRGFVDRLIKELVKNGLDSVMAVQPEYKSCWNKVDGVLHRVGRGFMPRQFKDPLYIGLSGLATVTHPALLRNGDRFGANMGVLEINDPACAFEVRDAAGLKLAENILPDWWDEHGVFVGEETDERTGCGSHSSSRGIQGVAQKKYPAPGWQTADCLLHRACP